MSRRRLLCLTLLIVSWIASQRAVAEEVFQIGQLPDLVWWASARDSPLYQDPGGTLAVQSGDPVGLLTDLSGQNHHALMGASVLGGGDAFRPLFSANAARGAPAILFDGVDDFLDLNSALFDGASSFTLGFAIAVDHADLRERRLFGAAGTNDGIVIGFANSGRLEVVARTSSTLIGLRDEKGHTLNLYFGPENTQIVIARYQAGGAFELWNNGQLVASSTAPTDALLSQVDKLIGNQNGAAGGSTPAPLPTGYSRFYFQEGMASRSAISDSQLKGLYDYWTSTLPGVQHQIVSPNVYWDATINTDRTLPVSRDVGHIQGVASGDGVRYVFYTSMIEKYDASWNALTHNESMFTGISNSAGVAGHSGDGDYYQGKIFVPAEVDFGGSGQFIAVYDANQPNLPLIKFKDITAQRHEVSSLTIAPEHGQHGVMYVTSFFQDVGGDRLWMYDLAGGDPNVAHFGDFLGSLSLPSELQGIQGVVWQAPFFYFSNGGTLISRVRYLDGLLDTHAERVIDAVNTAQGLAFEGHTLLVAKQSGSTTEIIEPLINADFTTTVPEPGTISLCLVALGLCGGGVALRRFRVAAG